MTPQRAHTDLSSLEKLSEGYEAEVFAWRPGQVLRLYREGIDRDEAPEQVGIPAALAGGIPVPSIGEAVNVAGREGVVMEHIDGRNVLDLVGGRPWLLPREGLAAGRLHAHLHDVPGPTGLSTVHERVAAWVGRAELPSHLATTARNLLAGLSVGDRLCHGDFHLGNLLVEPGGRRVVIDWGICAAGPPEADVARTFTLMRLGKPFEATPASRLRIPLLQQLATKAYLRGYRSARSLDLTLLWRWVAVRSIEHLAIVLALGSEDERSGDLQQRVEALVTEAQRRAG